ncbi:MAG TPA: hypothetical protein VGG51_05000 [Candidatus Cybelea sp.]|jgi:hypothetical protein
MMPTDPKPLGLIICMPTRGAISIETESCTREHLDGYPHRLLTVVGEPVVGARNQLAREARELDATALDFDPQYVLWVDDDAWWPVGRVDRAVKALEENEWVTMVAGVYSKREPYSDAVAVTMETKTDGAGGKLYGYYFPLKYAPGELTKLRFTGAHWFLVRRDFLNLMGDEPFKRRTAFRETLAGDKVADPNTLASEDISFCVRLREAGGTIVTECSLLIGHVDVTTGKVYFVNSPAQIANRAEAPIYAKGYKQTPYDHRTYGEEHAALMQA